MLDISLQKFHTMCPVLFDGKNVLREASQHENQNKLYSSLKQKEKHLSELYHSNRVGIQQLSADRVDRHNDVQDTG